MSLWHEERPSDSPFVEAVTRGRTLSEGSTIRPAEVHWHMVMARHPGGTQLLVVGPLTESGLATWGAGAEILWIKFKLGTFMPHLPTRDFRDKETPLPGAAGQSFWLKGSAWQYPDFENVEAFVKCLVREEVLVHDPVIHAALQDQLPELPLRTIRHHFLRATGLTRSHIYQFERARQTAQLLQQGVSILDAVYEAGYFDQPHLTRSLKRFLGYTPAQLASSLAAPG